MPVRVEGNDMVGERLIGTAMAFVLVTVAQQGLMQLPNMVLGQS